MATRLRLTPRLRISQRSNSFVLADLLVGELSHAVPLGTLDDARARYLHPLVLVLDELGYLRDVADPANVWYRLVHDRYLCGNPILVTTNKSLAA